jgi:hypothetical protein
MSFSARLPLNKETFDKKRKGRVKAHYLLLFLINNALATITTIAATANRATVLFVEEDEGDVLSMSLYSTPP